MSHRRSLPALLPARPLDDEDLVEEILLRLPPHPSFLTHASLVCKRWRRILSNPRFLRRFRKHHPKHDSKPPLLGYFHKKYHQTPVFTPTASFLSVKATASLVDWTSHDLVFFGCRHGMAVLLDRGPRREVLVWDPITGVRCHMGFPRGLNRGSGRLVRSVAVLSSAGDDHRVHGHYKLRPFTLVLVGDEPKRAKAFVCVYESKSDVWGDIISIPTIDMVYMDMPSILVGNTLCWLLSSGGILEFDFERQALDVIEKPEGAHATTNCLSFQPLRTEFGGLGLAVLSMSKLSMQLWARKSECEGGASWVLQKTVQLENQFSELLVPGATRLVVMMGYDEVTNVIFMSSEYDDFMIHIDSMQFRYLGERQYMVFGMYYPYRNFRTAETPDGERKVLD